jgi:hypothetical protein
VDGRGSAENVRLGVNTLLTSGYVLSRKELGLAIVHHSVLDGAQLAIGEVGQFGDDAVALAGRDAVCAA